jgi:hypothetical protein
MANRSVAWAEWDEELLGLELSELDAMSFDLGMTGFDEDEVTSLLTSVTYTHPTQKPVALAAEAISAVNPGVFRCFISNLPFRLLTA